MHEIERLGGVEGGEAGRRKVPTRDSGTGMGAAEYPPPPPPPNADGIVSRAGSEAGDAMDPRLQARERHLAMQEKIRSGAPTLLSPESLEDLNQKPTQVDSPDLSREIARVEAQFKKVHPVTPTGVRELVTQPHDHPTSQEKEALEFQLTEHGVQTAQLQKELDETREALVLAKEEAQKKDKKTKALATVYPNRRFCSDLITTRTRRRRLRRPPRRGRHARSNSCNSSRAFRVTTIN